MRTLSQDLLDAQAELNRKPESEIIIRDVMIRLTDLATTDVSIVSVLPPSVISDIPYCPIDGECYNGSIWRAWMNDQLYCQEVTDPTDADDWATTPVARGVASDWPDLAHRPSTESYYLFWGSNGDIKTTTPCTDGSIVNFRSSAYTVDTDHIALAAVSSTVVYMTCLHTNDGFQYLSLHRVTSSGVVDCPHTIIVDSDYGIASLTWFDAATLQGRDIIVLNERAYGHPIVVIYEDGVWSDPQPLLPQDIVDNYSFVRVAGLKVEDDQLLATGRIGRAGSTGLHPQACDVLFRSREGDHWTFDRYCYLCADDQKSPLLVTGNKVYYPGRGQIKHADQPYLIGGDPAGMKWIITDDLLSWEYEQPAPGVACAGSLSLADHDGDHSSYLKPGFWLWRYAGYNSFTVLVSTEGIDTLTGQGYTAGDRSFALATRDIAMRLMKDWASSQDWQWLSQQKHYDDCDLMDHLYAIAAAKITVRSDEDFEEAGEVDQTQLEEEDDSLVFQGYNKLGIFLTTVPFDAQNFHVKGRFQFQNDTESNDPGGLAMNLSLTAPRDPHIGHGFGVVGCAIDKYNFIAALAGLKDDKLFLLTRNGDEDSDSWTKLAEANFDGGTLVKDEIYEVELTRAGRHLEAKITHFASGGVPTRTELAEISHDWSEVNQMVPVLEDIGIDDDRAKVGVIVNIQVPETWLERVRPSADFLCRQAGLWDPTGDRQGPATEGDSQEDDYAEWDESKDIVISAERIALDQVTQSNKKSKYYLVEDVDAGTKVIRGNSSGSDFNWANDGAGGTWGLAIVNGPGRGFCYRVTGFTYQGGPGNEDEFTVGDAGADDLAEISVGSSYFHVLPGFYHSGRAYTPDAESYGLGTRARQHDEDSIIIRGVWAYDDERDKTLEWVMKDISAKAGILVWDLKKSIEETITPPATVQPEWLDDAQRDFDLTVTLPAAAGAGDSFVLIARATSKLAATPVDGHLADFAAVKLTYSYDGADWTVSLHQTSDGEDAVNRDDWVLVDEFSVSSGAGGKRLRFVGYEDFFSVYINDYRLRTFHTGRIYGLGTDGYSLSLRTKGYIGIWRTGATADWTDTEITQSELWARTDAVILDQRMNAVAGLERAIRDRRIKFFGTPAGALRISTFVTRDELPAIGDLLYSDGESPTDRIPTHIRVVGAEISEYIDHDAAAEYGLIFALAQAESLEEEEAYAEAQRLIEDAVSQSGARGQTAAAQLDWEVEDKIPVSYTPADGGPAVGDDYIVDSVQLSFRPGDMIMQASVRLAP